MDGINNSGTWIAWLIFILLLISKIAIYFIAYALFPATLKWLFWVIILLF